MWLSEHMAGAAESYFLDSEDSLTNMPRSQSTNCWEQQQPCDSQARRERFWASFLAPRTAAGLNRSIDEIGSMFNRSNFAHCAYGVVLDQLSPRFRIDVLCLQGRSVRPLPDKTSGFLEDLWKNAGAPEKKKASLNLLLQQD